MFENPLNEETVENVTRKLGDEIEKYTHFVREMNELEKRRKELSIKIRDSRREIVHLQEAQIDLSIMKALAE